MRYEVVYSKGDVQELVIINFRKKVNDLMKDGWRPQGGIETGLYIGKFYISQAMVKED